MREKPCLLVLDTNVWIEANLGWRKGHKEANELIAFARNHAIELAYAITTVKDVYYLVGADLKWKERKEKGELSEEDAEIISEIAWAVTNNMSEVATPVGMDMADVWMARKLRSIHNDLEDNLVIAAGERAGADYIVTSDSKLLANPHVRAMTAADMLKHLQVFEAFYPESNCNKCLR